MISPPVAERRVTIGVIAAVVLGAVLLAAWPALQHTVWWYPETDAYWLWVAALFVLVALSFRREPGRWLGPGWGVATALCLSGLVTLARDLWRIRSGGDLLQGALLGARRRWAGQPVYDLRGLDQSVNAPPFFIALVLPLAPLADRWAVAVFSGLSVVALLLFVVFAVRRLTEELGLIPRLWHLGLALTALTTYGAFQRSWRLGQADTILLLLLALTLAPRTGRWQLAASAAGMAMALKILPFLALLPVAVRSIRAPDRQRHRRFLALATAIAAGSTLVAVLVLGPAEVPRFVRNLPLLAQGTTSGNNYALANRITTFGDRQIRARHHPLPGPARHLSRGLTIFGLAALLLMLARFRRTQTSILMALSLAALPLVSPNCWDVYLIWGGALPALVGWLALLARRRQRVDAKDSLHAIFLGGGYLLAGTMGNTLHRDYHSGMTVQLNLPPWLDDAPTFGHLLLFAALFALAWRDHRDPLSNERDAG